MRKRTLFFLLLFLLLAYGGIRYLIGKSGLLFETQLIAIDTSAVTAISLFPERSAQQEILLKKEGKTWIASQGNRSVKATFRAITPLLAKLADIESHHIVTKDLTEWENYGVGADQGIRIRVFSQGDLLEDFLIGRIQYLEDSTVYTYIRLWEDEEVYAVEGPIAQALSPGFDSFRSKSLLDIDPDDVREIRWEPKGLDSALVYVRSAQVDSFLQTISALEGRAFADSFDPVRDAGLLEGRITFFASDWDAPVEVAYYRDSLEETPFIFYSTRNPDNYFSSDSAGLFRSLVVPIYSLGAEPVMVDTIQ